MHAQVNGTELYYETLGAGVPLLLMHGGLGFDHSGFRPAHDQLADQGTQVIYYDHRGNGRSARPESWEGITHDTFTTDADALREHLGLEKVVLLGHSYGGFLAMEYALRHQEHLSGLILLCTAPTLDYPDVIMQNVRRRSTPETAEVLMGALGNPTTDEAVYRDMWHTILPLYFKQPDAVDCDGVLARAHLSAVAGYHAFTNLVPNYNVLPRLGEIRVPTLVMAGRDDFITPPEQAERIQQAIPGAELVIFEESGHFPFVEEPAKYFDVVTEFVRRNA